MNANEFLQTNIDAFIDQTGTKFFKGPFTIDERTYDYKFIDKFGEDYCSVEQMEEWYVEIVKVLRNE